eukprot:6180367-Pleurochrysis_carterae.AAC.1
MSRLTLSPGFKPAKVTSRERHMPAGVRPRRLRGQSSFSSDGDMKLIAALGEVLLARRDALPAVTTGGVCEVPLVVERSRPARGRSLRSDGEKETQPKKEAGDIFGEGLALGLDPPTHGEDTWLLSPDPTFLVSRPCVVANVFPAAGEPVELLKLERRRRKYWNGDLLI